MEGTGNGECEEGGQGRSEGAGSEQLFSTSALMQM